MTLVNFTGNTLKLNMSLIKSIQQFDYTLFSKINGKWHNAFFDATFLFIREAALWMPFYIFLLAFITINFKRKGWIWSLYIIFTVIISNYISSNLIKEHFLRLRPCHDPLLNGKIRLLANYCPESSSFTSSHATNHFAISMFIFITFKDLAGAWRFLIFIWAALICYAQVYVGVHFPTDVIIGAIAGSIIGYFAAILFNAKKGLIPEGYINKT